MTRFEQIKSFNFDQMCDFLSWLMGNEGPLCNLSLEDCLKGGSCITCAAAYLSEIIDKPRNCWRCGGTAIYDKEHHMIICENCGVRSRPKKMSEDYVNFLKDAWNEPIIITNEGEEK